MKGYDPKWPLVRSLLMFEGDEGSTLAVDEKTNTGASMSKVSISRLSPDFPDGALFFPDMSLTRFVLAGSSAVLTLGNHVFSIPILLTDFGAGGLLRMFRSTSLSAYINPLTHRIYWAVNIDGAGWVNCTYDIHDPAEFLGVRHDFRFYISPTEQWIELDGVEVARVAHGKTSSAHEYQQFYFGQQPSVGASDGWIGFIGAFRWTAGDLRPEEAGTPITKYETLSALDVYREKVVLHSHFDGQNNATSADDTCGGALVFDGGAKLQTSSKAFGISALSLNGGTVHCDGIDFSAQRFTIEFIEKRTENDGINRYLMSIIDEGGVDHALSIASPYFGPVTLRKDGVDVSTSAAGTIGPTTTWQRWAIVRDGEYVAVFVGGQRSLLVNIGVNPLLSNGRFVLGKGGSVAPAAVSKDWIDECRITIGEARYNVLSPSIVPPTERFNEYGPSYCGGTTENPDGTVRPNTLVRVYHRRTGRLVSEGYSDQDGAYTLPTADTSQHVVVHLHDDEDVNAVVDDHVYPVLIS